jgi:hypothetical protein
MYSQAGKKTVSVLAVKERQMKKLLTCILRSSLLAGGGMFFRRLCSLFLLTAGRSFVQKD